MTSEETIQTWRWRIVKAGHTAKTFAALIEMRPSDISQFLNGRRNPLTKTFDRIEGKLRELGV